MEKFSIALAEKKLLLIAEVNGSDIFRNNAFVACLELLVPDHSKIVSTTAVLCCTCLHVLLHCKTAHSETLSKSPQRLLQPWLCEPWFRVPEPWQTKLGIKGSLKMVSHLVEIFQKFYYSIPKRKDKIEVFEVLRSFKHGYYLNQQDRSHALAASTHYSSAAHLPSYLRDVRVLYLGQGEAQKKHMIDALEYFKRTAKGYGIFAKCWQMCMK